MAVTDLVYIDSTGYHFADYPSFLAYLTAQYQNIYGADVYLGSDSQDGQWLGIVAQALYDSAAYGASIYNSFSPSTAQGVGLSRNVKINGLRRQSATNSTVELTIGGTAFTTITNGSAIDSLQQIWNTWVAYGKARANGEVPDTPLYPEDLESWGKVWRP